MEGVVLFVLSLVFRVLRWLIGSILAWLWPLIRTLLILAAIIAAVMLLRQMLLGRRGRRARA